MGKILLCGSDKGGVGKTTTAINTGVMLDDRGIKVIFLKADINPDLTNWGERRKSQGLSEIPIYEASGNIAKQILRLAAQCDVLIVDCAGHDSEAFRSALTVADILLTFVKPSSMFEKDTLTSLTETVRKAQAKGNPDLTPWVLFTRVKPNKVRAAVELDAELRSDSIWIQPLRSRISELDVFENACNMGAGVHDVARGPSLSKAKAQLELMAQEIGLI